MSHITYIPADCITEDHVLYIDALHGYVITAGEHVFNYRIWITWRDANGKHTRSFDPKTEIPVLATELAA